MPRLAKDDFYMAMAHLVAAQSTCIRLQVGCVLTDRNGEQIAIGYNGGPRNGANQCRHPESPGGCGCVHAEANAVIKATGEVDKIAYLTVSPCVTCSVMLVNAHVVKVVYGERYRDEEGLTILGESGVIVEQRLPPLT